MRRHGLTDREWVRLEPLERGEGVTLIDPAGQGRAGCRPCKRAGRTRSGDPASARYHHTPAMDQAPASCLKRILSCSASHMLPNRPAERL
jgi:hypothetical protein